ncbi:hypothetical protein [Antrihabitans cavernicola]|uniref:Uncharacterized protein n=1 Tax=Antrihabitans cavernicola TaxID=2495913 RepID=A0A5A7S377_9NOCA|nr:hypothetical protein [Spelaeibacter cavernicola]KAA0018948.1 hypothetical protein FOY51_23205 [Spelaeibacter cavernicola]
MTMTGDGIDDRTDRSYAAARRAIIRAHHPDVGGSAERLAAELARLDRRLGPAAVHEDLRPRLRRRIARGARSVRTRLPRKVPGSKRYFSI